MRSINIHLLLPLWGMLGWRSPEPQLQCMLSPYLSARGKPKARPPAAEHWVSLETADFSAVPLAVHRTHPTLAISLILANAPWETRRD